MMEVICSSEISVFKEPYGVTSQKRAYLIAISVKTSNLKKYLVAARKLNRQASILFHAAPQHSADTLYAISVP
jgi:hypothetical protein